MVSMTRWLMVWFRQLKLQHCVGWCYDPLSVSCRLLNVFARADEQRFGWRKFFFNRIELNHNLHTVKTVSVTILYTFHWQGVCILPKAKEKIHRRIDIRFVASRCTFMGSLSNYDGDGAMKTSLRKWSRAASNFIALIPSRLTRQMLAIFL